MKYKIYPCLNSDIEQSNIWVSGVMSSRALLLIQNPQNGKKIFCEGLNIDTDYIRRYDNRFANYKDKPKKYHEIVEPGNVVVTMSAWYRDILGIEKTKIGTEADVELKISLVSNLNFVNRLRVCFQHPQVAIRMATWIGIVSAVLGIVSVLCGIISFMSICPCAKLVITSLMAIAFCGWLLCLYLRI